MTRWILALACALGLAQAAGAQDYPTKPVKLVVGDPAGDIYPAGRDADLVARELAKQLAEQLGQQVVVENVPGARGTVATEQAARAAPDGYTLPNVPTAVEAGLPGDRAVSRRVGLVAPAGTPAPIVERLQWGDPKAGEHGILNEWGRNIRSGWQTRASDARIVVVRGTFAVSIEGQRARELDAGGFVLIPKGVKSNFGCAAMGRCAFVLHHNGPAGVQAAPPPGR
jgi:hypothetical protein